MVRVDNRRYDELLKKKKDLEDNRPHDIDKMRRWKHDMNKILEELEFCLLYTSPSPRDATLSRMPSSA